jgi:hypothetical protein
MAIVSDDEPKYANIEQKSVLYNLVVITPPNILTVPRYF